MDLKQFLELFSPRPGNHYIQITTKIDETSKALNELMQSVDGEFRLAYYGDEELADTTELVNAKIQYVHNFDNPFPAIPRDNDSVIFKDLLHLHNNPETLLRVAYTTLANNAEVVIMQEKGTMDIEKMKTLLEKFEFRTPNYIEVLPEYDLMVAKKMHMWGNGL